MVPLDAAIVVSMMPVAQTVLVLYLSDREVSMVEPKDSMVEKMLCSFLSTYMIALFYSFVTHGGRLVRVWPVLATVFSYFKFVTTHTRSCTN